MPFIAVLPFNWLFPRILRSLFFLAEKMKQAAPARRASQFDQGGTGGSQGFFLVPDDSP